MPVVTDFRVFPNGGEVVGVSFSVEEEGTGLLPFTLALRGQGLH